MFNMPGESAGVGLDVEANRNWKREALRNAKSSRKSEEQRPRERNRLKKKEKRGMRETQDNVWEREVRSK